MTTQGGADTPPLTLPSLPNVPRSEKVCPPPSRFLGQSAIGAPNSRQTTPTSRIRPSAWSV